MQTSWGHSSAVVFLALTACSLAPVDVTGGPGTLCADGIQNGAETDVDCGGGTCPACAAGMSCESERDCASRICASSLCQAPTCSDGMRNGNETDQDCGGDACPGCVNGRGCNSGSDCASGTCSAGICSDPVGQAVATGKDHTCLLTTSGGVLCWGANGNGQLGIGTVINKSAPAQVTGLTSGITAIAAGGFLSCALNRSGGVLCWGLNVGDGTPRIRNVPTPVTGLSSGATAISVGREHACALTAAGNVLCWGANSFGELGDGTTLNRYSPGPVLRPTSGVKAISTAGRQTCALTEAGSVYCWGYYNNSTCPTPLLIPGLPADVIAVASGPSSFTCALTSGGAPWCWGSNSYGMLGDGTTADRYSPGPVVGLPSGVADLSTTRYGVCARTAAGTALCWGANSDGEIGDGSTVDRPVPTAVSGLSSGVASLSIGGDGRHNCALTTSGKVFCWGYNFQGQLGDGTSVNRHLPVEVIGF